jgi:hypothetical protein
MKAQRRRPVLRQAVWCSAGADPAQTASTAADLARGLSWFRLLRKAAGCAMGIACLIPINRTDRAWGDQREAECLDGLKRLGRSCRRPGCSTEWGNLSRACFGCQVHVRVGTDVAILPPRRARGIIGRLRPIRKALYLAVRGC